MMEALLFIAAAFSLLIGFHLLDRWQSRRAWRRATEEAARYMRAQKQRGQ